MKNKRNRKLTMLLAVCVVIVGLSIVIVMYLGKEKTVEENGVLQIQNLEETRLDNAPKLPYEIKMYGKSIEAYNNPVAIYERENHDEKRYVSFSFTSESFMVEEIGKGIIVESDKCQYSTMSINYVGNIQTFTLEIPKVKEISTIIYPIYFYNKDYDKEKDDEDEKYKKAYIAFRITPETID